MSISVRYANENDCEVILNFIKELSIYEKLEDQVVATVEDIKETIFDKKHAEVLLLEADNQAVGFALFFMNYSTFLGKANIYLEDLFVKETHRNNGYGKMLLQKLATIALERGCERLDWSCLDWNEKAISFYKQIGAQPLSDWLNFRLNKEGLKEFIK